MQVKNIEILENSSHISIEKKPFVVHNLNIKNKFSQYREHKRKILQQKIINK